MQKRQSRAPRLAAPAETEYSARRVFFMSLPIFLELLLQLLVGNADQAMLSGYSQTAVAAVGNANQIINIAILVLSTLCMGATVLVAQSLGARDERNVSTVTTVSALLVLVSAALVSAALYLLPEPMFRAISVPEELMAETVSYTRIVALGLFVQGLYMLLCAVLRSHGLVQQVLFTAAVMNLLNIGGNALLINGLFGLPRLGAAGAAISSNVSKCVGLALAAYVLVRRTDARVRPSLLRPFPATAAKQTLRISLPCALESFSYQFSQLMIMKFVNRLGTVAINTKIYCCMMANAIYLYSVAIAQATQIVVGYLAGRGDLHTAGRRIARSVLLSIAVSESMNLAVFLLVEPIFRLFTQDAAVIALARQVLLVEFVLELGRSVNITMVRCLIAVGDVRFPVGAALFSTWTVAVGLGYLLGVHFGMGLVGLWIGMAADECLRGVLFTLRLRCGAWKRFAVAAATPAQQPRAQAAASRRAA